MKNPHIDSKTINQIRLNASEPNALALGYPVNRKHAFEIDLSLLGIQDNSMSTTYLNNIASPYYHGAYTTDNIKDIEVALMKILGKHFNLPNEFGYVTSGGTEANFACLWWHRNYLLKRFAVKPALLCSSRSHYSLKKIANQLDIEIININATYSGIDYTHLESILRNLNKPVIYSANFGATIDGSIDNIIQIKNLLDKYVLGKYKIHGDGAIYGLFIPYLEIYKDISTIFDLIDTLSFSGHKFLGAYNISGVALGKKSYLANVFSEDDVRIHIIQDAIDITFSGSRQGIFSLELYLLLEKALDISDINNKKTNLAILWDECLARAKNFYSQIAEIVGYNNPLLHFNSYQLSIIIPAPINAEKKLYLGKKYGLMPVGESQYGIYVFPRSTEDKINKFLSNYRKIIHET